MGVAGWILSACVGQDTPLIPDNASPDTDGRTCDPSAPFTNVVEVAGVNTSDNEAVPSLTSDEKTIVFTRLDGDLWHLYTATRASASTDVAFGNPTVLTDLSGNWDDYDPWLSASGDELLFSSDRGSVGGPYDTYHTHRDNGVFGTPTLFLPDWPANSERPFMTSDGSELFFSSTNASNAGMAQIYHSLNSTYGFSPPVLVPGLISDPNAYSNDGPVLSRDGLTMYFASDRTSIMHIYRAERASPSDPFNSAVLVDTNLGVYNGSWELPGWLSDDGCRLYFESNRNGSDDIFVASK